MALALVRCSIEADKEGTPHARARVYKFGKLEGERLCVALSEV